MIKVFLSIIIFSAVHLIKMFEKKAPKAPMTINPDDIRYVKTACFPPLRQCQGIAISPSGKYIAIIGLFGRNILIYKPDGTLVRDIPRNQTYVVRDLFFRNDHELIAPAGANAGPDAMLEIWNVENDSPSIVINGQHPGEGSRYNRVKRYASSGDIVVVKPKGTLDEVALINLSTNTSRRIDVAKLLGGPLGITVVTISKDGKFIATQDFRANIHIIDAEKGKVVKTIPAYSVGGTIFSLAFSPDGTKLVSGEGPAFNKTSNEVTAKERSQGIKIWDTRDGRLLRSIETGVMDIMQLSWSRDGEVIVGIMIEKSLFLSLETNTPQRNSA
ncbi:WD40 repeat domain-containing protein [Acetobacter estunensis]|uniref:WD40 repeat domain-containing protein n=1 Tax=Acetobacter estunensis TaxID=104097 RepID=UPI001C2D35B7|nr:WD40 repeat domain-containing protein [Acetobacter estunensis]MBV1836301.1 WD40 repeat domain-containing protein [Acetobacter estunensis]